MSEINEVILKSEKQKSTFGKQFKGFFIGFFVSAFIALTLKFISIGIITFNKIWNEQQIPYHIKWSYINSLNLARFRIWLYNNNYDTNSFLLSTATSLHKHFYEKMLAQIPEDDGVRSIIWYDYELRPIIGRENVTDPAQYVDKMLHGLKLMISFKSKSAYAEKVKRYELSNSIISYFISKQNVDKLLEDKTTWIGEINQISWLLINDKLSENKNLKFNTAIIDLMIQTFIAHTYYIYNTKFILYENMNCFCDEIKHLRTLMKSIPIIVNNYKKQTHDINHITDSLINVFNKSLGPTNRLLKRECNINYHDINQISNSS